MTNYDDIRSAADAAEALYQNAIIDRDSALELCRTRTDERDAVLAEVARLKVALELCQASHEPAVGRPLIGMSAPSNLWNQRVGEVGDGVNARRIFAGQKPTDRWDDQLGLVEDALHDGQMPVFSTKLGADIDAILRGDKDADAARLADALEALDDTVLVSFWHEPRPDIDGERFVAAHERLAPILQRRKVLFGPILNGFLLDKLAAEFGSYTSPDLMAIWDWFGIDTYESGTVDKPGPTKPVDRMPKLVAWLEANGGRHLPLVVGEYNGYSAKSIADMGEWLLSNGDRVLTGCCWNNDGGKGRILTDDRLAAFQRTLQDPRGAEYRAG